MTVTSLEYLTDRDIAAFWKKINSDVPEGECWLWSGGKSSDGYGVFSRQRKNEPRLVMRAHRLSYILTKGELSADRPMVRHMCDTPLCCNPDHLEPGDAGENARDIVNRGRHWTKTNPEKISRGKDHWAKLRPDLVPKGEDSGQAKLTATQVSEIRDKYKKEKISQRKLAAEYEVSQATIWQIVNHNYWKASLTT